MMTLPPVLERELRAQSRRRGTYWMRALCGLLAVLGFAGYTTIESGLEYLFGGSGLTLRTRSGIELFITLHLTLSVFLALASPLMVADSIARERREGTLGLLFLTPLQPGQVVLGKLSAHLLRVAALWLAALPVLLLPFLMGGVTWVDIVASLAVQLCVVLVTSAAGLAASALCTRWGRATSLAVLFMLLGAEAVVLALGGTAVAGMRWLGSTDLSREPGWVMLLAAGVGPWIAATGMIGPGFARTLAELGSILGRGSPWVGHFFWGGIALAVLTSAVLLLLALWFATRRVAASVRVRVPEARELARQRRWFGPLLQGAFRRTIRRRLARNPVFWLQAFTPTASLNRWGWALLVVGFWLFVFSTDPTESGWAPLVTAVPWGLGVILALAGAASFQQEHEEGTMELLLVTPLPAREIVRGRMLALRADFLPAYALHAFLGLAWTLMTGRGGEGLWIALLAGFLVWHRVPAVGVRIAVRRVHPLIGWVWVVLFGMFAPAMLGGAFTAMTDAVFNFHGESGDLKAALSFLFGFAVAQTGLSHFAARMAAEDLESRRYMLKPFRRKPG